MSIGSGVRALAFGVVLAMGLARAEAATVTPSMGEIDVGSTVSFTVEQAVPGRLLGFGAQITYDSDHLRLLEPNKYLFSSASKGTATLAGLGGANGLLSFTILFQALQAGIARVDVAGLYLSTPLNLRGFSGSGSVGINDLSPVPLPAAAPLFATALAGAGVFSWRKRRAQKLTAAV